MPQQHSPAKTMSSDPEHNDRSKLARGLNNRKLLDLVREAVLLVDLSGEIVFWNQGADQLYGWNANEALGQSPLELLQMNCPGHCLRFTIFFEKSGAGTPNSNRLPGRVSALQSRAGGRFCAMIREPPWDTFSSTAILPAASKRSRSCAFSPAVC